MKRILNLGKSLGKNEQKKIIGGVEGACSVTLACPPDLGGGSITCSGTLGRCHRYPELYQVQCDTDPSISCVS